LWLAECRQLKLSHQVMLCDRWVTDTKSLRAQQKLALLVHGIAKVVLQL